jgi:hypothetical protein
MKPHVTHALVPSVMYMLLALAFATPLLGLGERASQPPRNTGAVTGVVADGSTGEAVADAVVFLQSTPARSLGAQTRQLTDDRGRFAFVNLPGDVTYTISVTKIGFLPGGYGRDTMPTDPLRPIPLKADEWISNLKVSIWKPGSISGVVRDESGEPVVGVVVRVLQRVKFSGRDDFAPGPALRTDDHGAYRLAGLAPGRYVVQVPSVQAAVPSGVKLTQPEGGPGRGGITAENLDVMDVDDTSRLVIGRYPLPPPPQNGRQLAYPPAFYPSATAVAEATTIALKFGEEKSGVDVTLTPVASVRVSGYVDGQPQGPQTLTLRLLPAGLENAGFGAEVATALLAPDGRFTFMNVPAGSYTIEAAMNVSELTGNEASIGSRRMLPGFPTMPVQGAMMAGAIDVIPGLRVTVYNYRSSGQPYSARTPIMVGGADMNGVAVSLKLHASLAGSYIIEPDPARPDVTAPARLTFVLDPAGGEAGLGNSVRPGRGGGAGNIAISGVVPGQYWLRQQDAGWLVKSVAWNGRDYTNQPFDIKPGETITGVVATVTNAAPELSGVVRDDVGLKAGETMVIVFPLEAAQWKNTGWWPARVKAATLTSANNFRLSTLPAGDYLAAAISRSHVENWRDPDFLVRVAPLATRVTLTWGDTSTLDLRAVVVR